MSQYSDEFCTIGGHRTQRARKSHTCDACRCTIGKGDFYASESWLYEDSWTTVKRCARCELIYQHLDERISKEGDYEEFCDHELNCGHSYEERWGEPPPDELVAVAFMTPAEAQARLADAARGEAAE